MTVQCAAHINASGHIQQCTRQVCPPQVVCILHIEHCLHLLHDSLCTRPGLIHPQFMDSASVVVRGIKCTVFTNEELEGNQLIVESCPFCNVPCTTLTCKYHVVHYNTSLLGLLGKMATTKHPQILTNTKQQLIVRQINHVFQQLQTESNIQHQADKILNALSVAQVIKLVEMQKKFLELGFVYVQQFKLNSSAAALISQYNEDGK